MVHDYFTGPEEAGSSHLEMSTKASPVAASTTNGSLAAATSAIRASTKSAAGRRKKPSLSSRERNVRRIESNERERLRMHGLNEAFQVIHFNPFGPAARDCILMQ